MLPFRTFAIALAFAAVPALAQPAATPAATPPTEPPPKPKGWVKTANLGTNLSFSSSQDVIGQTDGSSETYGLNLKAGFNHFTDNSEWKNDVALVGTTTRTPNVPRFVKSSDELKISSMFLHFWDGNPDFGPYARLEAAAPIFKGEDVQSTTKTYNITRNDGSTSTVTASSLRLTDGFKPLTTKESAGFFWRPQNTPKLKVETRLGFAGLQVSADGQYSSKGADATGAITITELRDLSQAGLEAAVSVKGTVDEKSGYEAGVETLTPFVVDRAEGDDRDNLRLTNIDGFVKLTSNITTWASFGYDYKVKVQPQLVERPQQIHMIVLNANYNLF